MEKEIIIKKHISKDCEGSYISLPFDVEDGVERMDIYYEYLRFEKYQENNNIKTLEKNIIDFSLNSVNNRYLGSSGSNRNHIWISEYQASEGFSQTSIQKGKWEIIIGAYRICDEGVDITYRISFTMKQRRLFKGDTHVHTLGSDGFMTPKDTVKIAESMGLDFIIVTDHNNYAQNFLPFNQDKITVIPGMEWTHYKGHAGFIGVKKPLENSFHANNLEETALRFKEAKDNGAFTVLYHPFCHLCPWDLGLDSFCFDGVEVWNGIVSERNIRAIMWWHQKLVNGKRIPILGGSDFHRPGLLASIAAPCMCVYALSREREDILSAIMNGQSYISYLADGPGVDTELLGKSIKSKTLIDIRFFNLKNNDEIKIISDMDEEKIICDNNTIEINIRRVARGKIFIRFEVYRSYEKGLPPMLAMLSNPIYVERE